MGLKVIFSKLKTFFDVWKMWLFVVGLLASTNGAQMYYHEPEKAGPPIKNVAVKPNSQKTVIINKFDNELAEKLIKQEVDKRLNEHYESWRH